MTVLVLTSLIFCFSSKWKGPDAAWAGAPGPWKDFPEAQLPSREVGGIEQCAVAALRKEGVVVQMEKARQLIKCTLELGSVFAAGFPVYEILKAFSGSLLEQVNEFNKYLFIKHYLLFSEHHGRWAGLFYGGDVHACVSIHMCRHMYINTHLFIRFIGLFHYGLGWWLITHFLALAKVRFFCILISKASP